MRIGIYFATCILIGILRPLSGISQESQPIRQRFADTIFAPVRIIHRDDIRKMGATHLAQVLKYELNIEVEQFPADGGARVRVLDLNSRYFKVLIDGIPIAGSDMFGGHTDLNSIPLTTVDTILISYAPTGVAYGSGTLSGTVNLITNKGQQTGKTLLQAAIQEESAGDEYSLRSGHHAKGIHLQQLAFTHRLSKQWIFGINGLRQAFTGYQGKYNGKQGTQRSSYERGYEWSPYTSWNGEGYLSYQGQQLKATYTYRHFHSDLVFYGHGVEQEFENGTPLPVYSATDYRYINSRAIHQLSLQSNIRKAYLTLDISFQDASTKRKIFKVNVADNHPFEPIPFTTLYRTNTYYARGKLAYPLTDRLEWHTGFELDNTHVAMAVAPGTYLSQELDRTVSSLAGFTYLQWRIHPHLAFQPGLRLSTNGRSNTHPNLSAAVNYTPNDRNNVKLIAERVHRFPNHRELFTHLENEFNLLEGDEHLQPETGHTVQLSWKKNLLQQNDRYLSLTMTSAFTELKGRIAIAAVPARIPTQDAFKYTNLNSYASWRQQLLLTADISRLHGEAGIAWIGLKGNDFASAQQYNKYLFHTQVAATIGYNFQGGYWLRSSYRFTGRQPIYSFERILPATTLERVLNRAPAWHLLEVNAGTSFFHQQLELSVGARNLLNTTTVGFTPVDGQEHYTGDLRTQYIGYGRSCYLRLGMRINR